jgi:hypothetical protein
MGCEQRAGECAHTVESTVAWKLDWHNERAAHRWARSPLVAVQTGAEVVGALGWIDVIAGGGAPTARNPPQF